MLVSQKAHYALRAIFELAMRYGQGPVKIADIANAEAIPVRFLEVILSQLKQAGFVESRRGNVGGGYILSRLPAGLTVGEVLRFIEGPITLVECTENKAKDNCPLIGECVLLPMWERARNAISTVYDGTTFQNLVDQKNKVNRNAVSYSI